MNTIKEYTLCFVMGNKRTRQLFSIHESGTQIVLGDLGDEISEKRIKPLLFRQHIYLNPAKMMREYQEAGFEPLTTLCVPQGGHLQTVEMYRTARRVIGERNMKKLLRNPDARFLLELLVNMEGHDDESKAMQLIADEVLVAMEKQTNKTQEQLQHGHANR